MIDPYDSVTKAELRAQGIGREHLEAAVETGHIVRARRGNYVSGEAPEGVKEAVRVGGRLTCVSLLALFGVFVFGLSQVHVHIARGSSRLRSPHDRTRPLGARVSRSAYLHWHSLIRPFEGTRGCVGIVDALVHAVRCQPTRHAIATLDSALNKGLIAFDDLADVFGALPARFGVLRPLLDGRAESGPETLVRLMARALGCSIEVQKTFAGIGRVDLVLDGWLVVECDGREYHEAWSQQVKDRNRALALAARGFHTLRLTAAWIMYRPDEVVAALRGLLEAHRASALAG